MNNNKLYRSSLNAVFAIVILVITLFSKQIVTFTKFRLHVQEPADPIVMPEPSLGTSTAVSLDGFERLSEQLQWLTGQTPTSSEQKANLKETVAP